MQQVVRSVGDKAERVFAAKVIDGQEGIENIRPLDAVAGKLIFVAAGVRVHMIFDAASEHFRLRMVNQIVNIKGRIVLAVAETLCCQRRWRIISVATKPGTSTWPGGLIVQRG